MTSQHITILPGQPAAIVRDALDERIANLVVRFKSVKGDLSALVRDLADIKPRLPHGGWGKLLKRLRLSRATAHRWLTDYAASNVSHETFEPFQNPAEDEEDEGVAPSGTGVASPLPPSPPSQAARKPSPAPPKPGPAAPAPSPFPPEQRCRNCRVHGRDLTGCENCRLKNLPAEREPGDDTQQIQEDALEENPWLKPIDAHARPLLKIADEVARLDVPAARAQQVKTHLAEATKELRELAEAPVKAGDPKPGKCGRCGRQIQWVVSRRGKKFALDAQPSPRGRFEIVKGVALYVKKEDRKNTVRYQPHQQSCH